MECVPCGQDGCEGTKVSRCLVELGPEEVVARLDDFLRSGPGAAVPPPDSSTSCTLRS
jgi:hypothetical protein